MKFRETLSLSVLVGPFLCFELGKKSLPWVVAEVGFAM